MCQAPNSTDDITETHTNSVKGLRKTNKQIRFLMDARREDKTGRDQDRKGKVQIPEWETWNTEVTLRQD